MNLQVICCTSQFDLAKQIRFKNILVFSKILMPLRYYLETVEHTKLVITDSTCFWFTNSFGVVY